MLSKIHEHWNNNTLEYDLEKYNWPAWALSVVQEVAPKVKELETIHEVLTPSEIVKMSQHVQNACSRKDFMELFDKFVQEYVPSRVDNRRFLIQRQGTLRVVIPQQAKVGRRLQFHQGIFVKHAWPVTLKPGQSHLFFQEHLHGNVNNEEGYTRVSLDMRILLEGEEWGRRLPGGFMRLPGDHEVAQTMDYTGKSFITYAGWNSKFSKDIPLPMQRAIIEPYCQKNKIAYTSYEFENEHMDWQPALEHYIKERPDGIVLCSMYSLTDDPVRRSELLQIALDNGVELHFANELVSLKSKDDLEKVEMYLNFAVPKKGPQVWEEGWCE